MKSYSPTENASVRTTGMHRSPSRPTNTQLNVTLKSIDSKRNRSVSRNTIRPSFTRNEVDPVFTFVTFGASTEFVRKKVYPSLWNLFKTKKLPKYIFFYAFSRNAMTRDELREKCIDYMTVAPGEEDTFECFWKANSYYIGSYLARMDYDVLHKDLISSELNNVASNRLYYINIPNSNLEAVAQNIRSLCQPKTGWTRVIMEKPFGKDSPSSKKITQYLLSLCSEDDLYRVDPFLNKDIIKNIPTIRFCNLLFSSTWNRKMIQNVVITIKDPTGIDGNGKYFDTYGIICDVMQIQALQLLALIAMEKPISMKPEDIQDEKVKLLKCVPPVSLENAVLGQYFGNPLAAEGTQSKCNYSNNPDVARNSNTPTFCAAVVRVDNERWDGVPFILKCGKAMDERKCEIRIRYENVPADIFNTRLQRNELIIEIEPKERVYVKAVTKAGIQYQASLEGQEIEVPFNNDNDFAFPCKSYDNIVLNAFDGDQTHFIKTAEISQAWRIFRPLLKEIDNKSPLKYTFGTKGPPEVNNLIKKYMEFDNVEEPHST